MFGLSVTALQSWLLVFPNLRQFSVEKGMKIFLYTPGMFYVSPLVQRSK